MRLELQNVEKSFWASGQKSGRRQVFEKISLDIPAGERIGITGPSGTGKTTLGLILAGLLRPDKGEVMVNHSSFWALSNQKRRELGQKLQMVFQHPESSFDPRWRIRESLAEPYRLTGIRPENVVLETHLEKVGLAPSVLFRYPSQLSGGELQRIAIARIMILKPKLIILDEPTAMLDVITQAKIMWLLDEFHRESKTGYALISHDSGLVQKFCNRIFCLENGHILDCS